MKIRFKYERLDEVKYVGHLDVMSMFDRVFRRCNISLKYSQGFTKRSQIIFALPSSVGIISKCEYFETEVLDCDESKVKDIVCMLNSKLPKGFNIIDAYIVNDKVSIMSKVISAKYTFNILCNNDSKEKIENLFNSEKIFIEKIAKNGAKYDDDIKQYILSYEIKGYSNEVLEVLLHLKAGSKENLNPIKVISAIEKANIFIDDYEIIKEEVLLNE